MYGRDPSGAAGAIDTPSNIANPAQTFRIYEAWIEREFLDGRLGVRAGLYALDGEFDVKGVSAVLMNSGFGTGIDLSQTGLNGPCIYSTGCLGARVRYRSGAGSYLQLAVMDAVAGDPDDPYGTRVQVGNGEGVLAIGEYGYERDLETGAFLRAALGLWYYSSDFDDLLQADAAAGPARSRARPGLYALLEGELLRETPDGSEGLSGFLRAGTEDPEVNQVEYFASAGVAYTGLLPGRGADVMAFGVLVPVNGDEYIDAQGRAGSSADRAEYAFECTYWMPVLSWLSLQLDAQYIVNPGTDPALDDALVLAVRSRIVF
jgi:porin